jgi:PilZ domain
MDEHRNAPRHRVLKAGTIGFGGGAINCMVRNISDTGAMLDAVEVPEQFTLALPADGQHMSCHVVWRREKRIGVAFD